MRAQIQPNNRRFERVCECHSGHDTGKADAK
jgi:hypothetical protein